MLKHHSYSTELRYTVYRCATTLHPPSRQSVYLYISISLYYIYISTMAALIRYYTVIAYDRLDLCFSFLFLPYFTPNTTGVQYSRAYNTCSLPVDYAFVGDGVIFIFYFFHCTSNLTKYGALLYCITQHSTAPPPRIRSSTCDTYGGRRALFLLS